MTADDADAQRHHLSFEVARPMLQRVNSTVLFSYCEKIWHFGGGQTPNLKIPGIFPALPATLRKYAGVAGYSSPIPADWYGICY